MPPQVANNFRGSLAWYVVPRYGTTGGSISRSESSVTATVFQTAPARSKANPPMPRINTTLAQISSTECSAESSPEEWMSRHVAPEQRAAISGLTVCLPALVAMEDGLALFNKNFSLLVQRLLNSFMVAHLRRSVDTDAPKDQTDLASSIFVVCARFLQESSRRISAESTTASECSVTVLQYIMDSLSYTPVTAIGRVTSAPILSSMVTGLLFGTSSKVGEHDNPTGESVFRPTPVATVLHSKRPISNAGSKMLWRRPARYFSVLCRIDASGGRSRFKNTQLLHMTTFSLLRPVLRNSLSPASGGTDAIPSLMQAAVQYLTVLLDDVAAYGVELARLRKAGFVNAINHSASNAHAEAKPEAPWIRRLGTMRDTNVGNVASEVVENSLVEGLMESVVVETLRIFSFLCSGGVRHILTKSMGAGQPDSLLLERILPRVCGFGIDDLHHLNFHTQSDLAAHSHIQLLRFLHQHSERLGINVDVAEADFIGRILRYQGHNELVADQAFCLFNETRTNPLPVGSEKATMHSSHGIPRMQHYAPAFIKLFAQNPRSMAHHLAASLPSMVCEGRPCSVILHLLLDLPLLCAVLASVDLHSFDAFVASAKSQGRSTRSKKAGNEANVVDSMNRSGGSAFEATSTKSTSSVPQQSPQRTAKIPAIEATVNCVLRDSIMNSSVVISDDKVFAHDSCAQVCELTHRGWKHCSWANSARLAKHVAVAPASQRASNEPTKTTNIGVGTQQFTDVRVAVFDQLQDAFPWNANVAEVCEFIPRFLFLFFDTILDRIAQQESKTSANSSEVVETALEVCLVIIARAPFVFGPSSFQQVVQRILCERMMALFEACPQLAGRLNGLLCHTSQTLFSMLQRRMSLGLRPSPLDKVRPCPTTIDSWYWRSLHHLALYCCWLVGEYSSQELLSLRTSVDDGGKVAESSYLHLVNGVNTVVAALMMISATSNSSRLDFDSVTVSAHDLVDAVPALLVRTEASPSTATSPHGASPEATESTPDSPSSQGSVSTTPEKAHRHRTPPSSNLSPNATVFEAGPTPMPPRHRSAPVRSAPASSDVPTRSNKEYEVSMPRASPRLKDVACCPDNVLSCHVASSSRTDSLPGQAWRESCAPP